MFSGNDLLLLQVCRCIIFRSPNKMLLHTKFLFTILSLHFSFCLFICATYCFVLKLKQRKRVSLQRRYGFSAMLSL